MTTVTRIHATMVIQKIHQKSVSIAPPCAERLGGSDQLPQPGLTSAACDVRATAIAPTAVNSIAAARLARFDCNRLTSGISFVSSKLFYRPEQSQTVPLKWHSRSRDVPSGCVTSV